MALKIKQMFLIFTDIFLLYVSLFSALILRYGHINNFLLNAHLVPFSIIFVLWLIIFYISGLYKIDSLKTYINIIQTLIISVLVGIVTSIIIFYTVPYFKISPKTNLILFSVIFITLDTIARLLYRKLFSKMQKKILIIGNGDESMEIQKMILENPHWGYKIVASINSKKLTPDLLKQIINSEVIDIIAISDNGEYNSKILDLIYENISLKNIEAINLSDIYELLFKKSPISETKYFSLITNISRQHRIYETIKKPLEMFLALILLILLSPLFLLITILVKLTSLGPIIYKQIRVGIKNKPFILYKFRTMVKDAEKNGVMWAGKNDSRITRVGKILRLSHLDELPQLVNILKGDLSFVGPRPERPEFIKSLSKKIPYYDARHLIKPGITGWAQVNYKYGASIEDAHIKLQYDIYYIKYRTFIFDSLILLRTLKMFIFNYK